VLDQGECGLEPGFKGGGPEVAITLLQELRAKDIDEYKNMRMSKETFNMLLEKVRPYIMRSFTNSFVQLNFDILFELVCLLFPAIFTMCFCLHNILMILIPKTILIG